MENVRKIRSKEHTFTQNAKKGSSKTATESRGNTKFSTCELLGKVQRYFFKILLKAAMLAAMAKRLLNFAYSVPAQETK